MGDSPARKSLFIVDRQHVPLFEHLYAHFSADPDVEIVWDRRRGERRRPSTARAPERRGFERRGAPPESWVAVGFVFVPGDLGTVSRRR
jgi:hypothetical protein